MNNNIFNYNKNYNRTSLNSKHQPSSLFKLETKAFVVGFTTLTEINHH